MHLQKNLIDQPNVITPPPPPEPHHARATNHAAEHSHPDQRSVLDRTQQLMLPFVVLRIFLQRLAVFDADERAGDDDEAGEQDPRAEGRE